MARKKPTISEIAKQHKAAGSKRAEEKFKFFRDIKKLDPVLAAEILKYVREWKFDPTSEARADCEYRADVHRAVVATLKKLGIPVAVGETSFISFVSRLEK